MKSIINEIVGNQYTFVRGDEQLTKVVEEDRFCQIQIRCGGGRIVCAAQDAQHFIDIIKNEGSDYVRDVSVHLEDPVSFKNKRLLGSKAAFEEALDKACCNTRNPGRTV